MLLSIAPTRKRAVAAARLTSAYTASMALLVAPLLVALDAIRRVHRGRRIEASPAFQEH